MLDLSSLRKAIEALDRSLRVARDERAGLSEDAREAVQAGVIQQFEVAYEQCWKFIQRWIRENGVPEEADHPRTRKDLFRLAARYELIPAPEPWFEYGDARNLTSHTYDESQAAQVYEIAQRFLPDAQVLLERLAARTAS